MLEITYGRTRNQIATNDLVNALRELDLDGSLYIGYPIIATADESVMVDALLVTLQHGLVAFSFADKTFGGGTNLERWKSLSDNQDKLYVAIENSLRRHDNLRKGRNLVVDLNAVTIVPNIDDVPEQIEGRYADADSVQSVVSEFGQMSELLMKPLQAALQRVSTIKPPKRRSQVTSPSSKGAAMRYIRE